MNVNEAKHEAKGTAGPIIGLIVILAIILIGGVYAFRMIQRDNAAEEQAKQQMSASQEDTTGVSADIMTQGTSDEPADIERDLDAFGPAEIDSSSSF